jgi:two-component system, OmpR family, alkaline phosphatase synthesis response regulator PhoP
MESRKVLIIEDDNDIVDLLKIHLEDLHCDIKTSYDGEKGLSLVKTYPFDLIILDLMLPGMDGVEVCRKLRADNILIPVMMLTAKSEEIDKVLGLETGADDYLTKPFSVREFIARTKAIFRRMDNLKQTQPQQRLITHGEMTVDLDLRKVMVREKKIELTPKEFDLLALMAKSPGRNYSRAELLNFVWGYEFQGYEHTVNSHINRLRSKIETKVTHPQFILTSWGIGYRFNEEL